ncbi:MAG: hypothetical protein CMK07_03445 [Ponticaulis sp.]|nr:hypothetical protein [Ponticaulis sp.]
MTAEPLSAKQIARRNQVLDAASECFVEKGFHRAGMAEIADRAQMSSGHIYHYFKNKDDIIEAIVDREIQSSLDRISELENLQADKFADGVIAQLETHLNGVGSIFKSRLNFEIIAESERNPAVEKRVQFQRSAIRTKLTNVFASKLGLTNADIVADACMAVFFGTMMAPGRSAEEQHKASLNPLLTAFLRGVLAPAS